MPNKLHLIFLWHMHQPYYAEPMSGHSLLPWVRLHGVKDYYGMAAMLREFPRIQATFNYVPSLVEQLRLYEEGKATDVYQKLGNKPADELEESERQWILKNFFAGHYEHMIAPLPRLNELWRKMKSGGKFSTAEIRDLQVLFRLAWMDPDEQKANPNLAALIAKGHRYVEEDKTTLDCCEREILGKIIPEHVAAAERGQIELSASPYYHPILPLLIDSNIATVADPRLKLPRERFVQPDDAARQVRDALASHERTFGRKPRGMWPSEGSVSEAVCAMAADHGIEWLASDEDVLAMSQGGRFFHRDSMDVPEEDDRLYSVYEYAGVKLFFRDHRLSDLIGFTYSKFSAVEAADDFVRRLKNIAQRCWKRGRNPVVSVILDGENPWESYPEGGRPFLRALYGQIENQAWIDTTTPVRVLANESITARHLSRLHPGSWIDHNFNIWIGHPEDNLAWEQLAETRRTLCEWETHLSGSDAVQQRTRELAWKEILIAEGSDWFWWYGDDHSSPQDAIFDQLFRTHLLNVYRLIERPSPAQLDVAIKGILNKTAMPEIWQPFGPVTPVIDGRYSSYFEWLNAGGFRPATFGSAMHTRWRTVSCILFAPGKENSLNLLIEWRPEFLRAILESESVSVHVLFAKSDHRVVIPLLPHTLHESESFQSCTRKVTEVSLSLPQELSGLDAVEFSIDVKQKGKIIERVPDAGHLNCMLKCESIASV